jgi:ABC-type glutathione transport system ATPase component
MTASPATRPPAPAPSSTGVPLLVVDGLRTLFRTHNGVTRAVDSVSWTLSKGEVLGVVGESGCGKSVTALSIMGLVPNPPGCVGGSVRLNGRELVGLPEQEMRSAASVATKSRWSSRNSLIFHAADRAVKGVYIAGRPIVVDGQVMTLDHRGAGEQLIKAQTRMMASTTGCDYRKRTADELAPLSLPIMS